MARKEQKATDKLNVSLAAIETFFALAKDALPEDHSARKLMDEGLLRCEGARDHLLTIQFHVAQI